MKLIPYCTNSTSVNNLKQELGNKLIVVNPNKKAIGKTVVLNWGNSNAKVGKYCKLINHPISVKNSANKINAFKKMSAASVSTVEWTTDIDKARVWLETGYRVVERNEICGHSGIGINIVNDSVDELNPDCQLFTKYIAKREEFRVHVFNGIVIDYQMKKARIEKPDSYCKEIRNHSHGWVFCRDGVNRNEIVMNEAIKAVKALQLDFGAVDVILANNKAYILEVNSAPGIEGLTVLQYIIALEELGYV